MFNHLTDKQIEKLKKIAEKTDDKELKKSIEDKFKTKTVNK